jgi:hypothetical protein
LDELDKAWEFLKANPSYQAELSGFADDRGSYEYNLRLSQRRVNAVVDYLWSLGCERKRLALKFFGEEEPVANNLTPDGRSRNRRADITFFRKAEDVAPAAAPKAAPKTLPATTPAPTVNKTSSPQPKTALPQQTPPTGIPAQQQSPTSPAKSTSPNSPAIKNDSLKTPKPKPTPTTPSPAKN